MSEVKSEIDCVLELRNALQILEDILELENSAIKKGDIQILQETAASKIRLSAYLQRLWSSYREEYLTGVPERQECFGSLGELLAAVRKNMELNIRLLTALKVSTAEKIDAGIAAWKQHQNQKLGSYCADGDSSDQGMPLGVTLGRLI